MVRVSPKPGERIESTIKRFKKLCEREGVIKEVKKHTYHETKSQIRRRKLLKAIRRKENEQNNTITNPSKNRIADRPIRKK
jgi:small subunit ribosomal protein S21